MAKNTKNTTRTKLPRVYRNYVRVSFTEAQMLGTVRIEHLMVEAEGFTFRDMKASASIAARLLLPWATVDDIVVLR